MNQTENTLPQEHEDSVQISSTNVKSWVQHTPLPQHQGIETGSPLLTGQQATLAKLICSRLVGDPVLTYANTHSYKYVHTIHTN